MKKLFKPLIFIFLIAGLVSCEEDWQPKPRGFFRIQLPEKGYKKFQPKGFPYSFDVANDAVVTPPPFEPEKYWINIHYPRFKAQIHVSYKKVDNNLDTLLNDMHKMMNKHIPKANAINEQMYLNKELKVYGMAYEIVGSEAASPYQFYLTDSTTHFLRGALYFNFTPNNDSLQPVIDFLEADILRMIESFKWEDKGSSASTK